MLSVLRSTWPLLAGVMLLMVGNGMQGTLLGIRGGLEGIDAAAMSLMDECVVGDADAGLAGILSGDAAAAPRRARSRVQDGETPVQHLAIRLTDREGGQERVIRHGSEGSVPAEPIEVTGEAADAHATGDSARARTGRAAHKAWMNAIAPTATVRP